MSRRPDQRYTCGDLEELARQLLFVPAGRRANQIRRAEALHDLLDPQANYPIDFLKFRITGHRSAEDDQALLVGQAVLADLRLLIESLSRSMAMTLAPGEEAESPDDLAHRLNVSLRTITRWRKIGLRVRWVAKSGASGTPNAPDNASSRLMILRSAADDFVARHAKRIHKASQFTQMTDAQRASLLKRARRLALARELTLNQTAAHLAKRTGRAAETLRQMLLQHDARQPQDAIFTDHTGPLSPRQQELIARAHRRGVPVRKMAQRFNKTHSTIYRAIRQRRAGELRKLEIAFVSMPTFNREDADQVILRPVRAVPVPCDLNTSGLSEVIAALYTQPGLSPAVAGRLLVQLNYLKFSAAKLRDGLDRYEPGVTPMNELETMLADITQRQSELARAHLHLVLAVAQRQMIGSPHLGTAVLVHLLELGSEVLYDAIAHFDPGKDQSFVRFVTYRLQKRFAQVEMDNPRASRKLDAQKVVDRLMDQAKQAGVTLQAE